MRAQRGAGVTSLLGDVAAGVRSMREAAALARRHNADRSQTYTLAPRGRFSRHTFAEFRRTYLMQPAPVPTPASASKAEAAGVAAAQAAATHGDYRHRHRVAPVGPAGAQSPGGERTVTGAYDSREEGLVLVSAPPHVVVNGVWATERGCLSPHGCTMVRTCSMAWELMR